MYRHMTLRKIMDYFAVALIIIAMYMLFVPFIPAVGWWIKHDSVLASHPSVQMNPGNVPSVNTLHIPSIDVWQPIHEGLDSDTVDKGVWRRPQTSTPDKASNTVLVGHRFVYYSSGVFYHLDKLKMGDQIIVYWQGTAYEYAVTSMREVSPDQVDVEALSDKPILTLYTCTPLITAQNRLVIKASFVGGK
jgi:LPXTG-site transpeptidase (sortase) family protein